MITLGLSWGIAALASALAVAGGVAAGIATQHLPRWVLVAAAVVSGVLLALPKFIIMAGLRVLVGRIGLGAHLADPDLLTGTAGLTVGMAVAYLPLSFVVSAIFYSVLNPALGDVALLAGWKGLGRLRLLYGHITALFSPSLWAVMCTQMLSDPLSPQVFSHHAEWFATRVWWESTATTGSPAATPLAALLLLPCLAFAVPLGLYYHRYFHRTPVHLVRKSWSAARTRPVGIPLGAYYTTIAVSFALPVAVLVVLVQRALGAARPMLTHVLPTTLGVGVLTLAISLLAATVLVVVRRFAAQRGGLRGRRVVDSIVLGCLLLPGATFGRAWQLLVEHLPEGFPQWENVSVALAVTPQAVPFMYATLLLSGSLVSEAEYRTARFLGLGRMQALRTVGSRKATQYVIAGFIVVLSSSTISVAPLMWVTYPESQLLVTQLYRLLDAANYPQAFALSLVLAAVVIFFSLLALLGVRGQTHRKRG